MRLIRLLILTLTLLASSFVYPATFNVSSTPELREALNIAATNGEADDIILSDGVYKTTDDGKGQFIYLSNEHYPLVIKGSSAENVVISGDKTDEIFEARSTVSQSFTISHLTFEESYGKVLNTNLLYLSINNVLFENNNNNYNNGLIYITGEYGGGDSLFIKDSEFRNNLGINIRTDGYYMNSEISNSIFTSSDDNWMIFSSTIYSSMKISNCIFNNKNDEEEYIGKGIYFSNGTLTSDKREVINSLFVNTSISYYESGKNLIHNSIFLEETEDFIVGDNSKIVDISNSYLDPEKVKVLLIGNGNIYDEVNLGFSDENNHDFRLTASSGLINAGSVNLDGYVLPESDIDGNARIADGYIDIGPYEYSSTRPSINTFSYVGDLKEKSEINFSVDYTIEQDGRSLDKVQYDYSNDGSWTIVDSYTFSSAGSYLINVKVIDTKGEFSIVTLNLDIEQIPFVEMSDEQKLVTAISVEHYEEIMSIISDQNSNHYAQGQQWVIDFPSSFGLLTETEKVQVVDNATAIGFTTGQQYVQDNLTEFGLVQLAQLSPKDNEINALPEGWSLISTRSRITDLSIFDSATVIWIYQDSHWKGWSSDLQTLIKIDTSGDYGVIESIPKNAGIWVSK